MIELFLTKVLGDSPRITVLFFQHNESLLEIDFPKVPFESEDENEEEDYYLDDDDIIPDSFSIKVQNDLKTNKQLNLEYIQDEPDRLSTVYE